MTPAEVWLVGESNPYGSAPRFALFPRPRNSAGWRLCHKVLGLGEGAYLHSFERANLCDGPWSIVRARERARELEVAGRILVLLGAKVARAFGEPFEPFSVRQGDVVKVVLPHPSGRCLLWNEPGAYERARVLLRPYSQALRGAG